MKKDEESFEKKKKIFDDLQKEIILLKEEAENLERELSFQEECYEKLHAEKALLTKQRISEDIAIKKLQKTLQEESYPLIQKKPFALYDMIVHIDSFQRIFWQVELNENPSENAINYLDKPPNQIVIGIMGREKVGKSYIMGKLCGVDLPVGYNIQTQGLSMKFSNKDHLLTTCLDSAGVHAPVYYYDSEIYEKFLPFKHSSVSNSKPGISSIYKNNPPPNSTEKEFDLLTHSMRENLKMQMINDRKLTETFIEDFILYVSKVILIVVGQLTQDDQAIVERIRREYKEKKFIIIIHNFMYLSALSSIKDQIQKDIYKSCEVEERFIPGTEVVYFCEKLDPNSKSKYQIAHFIYCQENTEIGKEYNGACLRHIWDKIKTIDEREKFNVVESLSRFFKLNYKNYIKITQNHENRDNELVLDPLNQNFDIKDSLVDLIYDPDTQYISLILKDESLCVTPQNPTFTALGSLIVNNLSEFEPKYELIEYSDNEFVIAFEICNLEVETMKVEITREINNENMLILRGNKVQINTNYSKKKFNNLGLPNLGGVKYGLFEKMISISGLKDEYLLKMENQKPKVTYKDGVLLVFFSKKVRKIKGSVFL